LATIRDLKTPLEALTENDRFELVREIRQLRREMKVKPVKAPRASPAAKATKPKKKLSTADLMSSLSPDETAKLIARLRAQMEGTGK
jgi:hypothetical protein